MIVGIPKEIKKNENRISLTPFGAEELIKSGNSVLIEKSAGNASGFSDQDYIDSGASIVSSPKEIYSNSDMIVKVKEPIGEELNLIKEDQIPFFYINKTVAQKILGKNKIKKHKNVIEWFK